MSQLIESCSASAGLSLSAGVVTPVRAWTRQRGKRVREERNQLLSITGHGLLIKEREGEGAVGDSKLSTSLALAPWVVRLTDGREWGEHTSASPPHRSTSTLTQSLEVVR